MTLEELTKLPERENDGDSRGALMLEVSLLRGATWPKTEVETTVKGQRGTQDSAITQPAEGGPPAPPELVRRAMPGEVERYRQEFAAFQQKLDKKVDSHAELDASQKQTLRDLHSAFLSNDPIELQRLLHSAFVDPKDGHWNLENLNKVVSALAADLREYGIVVKNQSKGNWDNHTVSFMFKDKQTGESEWVCIPYDRGNPNRSTDTGITQFSVNESTGEVSFDHLLGGPLDRMNARIVKPIMIEVFDPLTGKKTYYRDRKAPQ